MTKKYNYTMKTGRPRIFNSPEDMQKAVNAYFNSHRKNPTVHGLCLSLDFSHRSSLLDYEGCRKDGYDKEYFNIIRRAKEKIAEAYERDIRDKRMARGCIFALNAMFNCKEQSAVDVHGQMTLSDMAAAIKAKRGSET